MKKRKISIGQKKQDRGKSVREPRQLSALWQRHENGSGGRGTVSKLTPFCTTQKRQQDKAGYYWHKTVQFLMGAHFGFRKKQLYQQRHHKIKRCPNLVDLSICPVSNNLHQFKYSRRILQKAEKITSFAAEQTLHNGA